MFDTILQQSPSLVHRICGSVSSSKQAHQGHRGAWCWPRHWAISGYTLADAIYAVALPELSRKQKPVRTAQCMCCPASSSLLKSLPIQPASKRLLFIQYSRRIVRSLLIVSCHADCKRCVLLKRLIAWMCMSCCALTAAPPRRAAQLLGSRTDIGAGGLGGSAGLRSQVSQRWAMLEVVRAREGGGALQRAEREAAGLRGGAAGVGGTLERGAQPRAGARAARRQAGAAAGVPQESRRPATSTFHTPKFPCNCARMPRIT